MTMEVEPDVDRDAIINILTSNEKICFKSQQRGESDLTKKEKVEIATEIYDKSKLNFLMRFGEYISAEHLIHFEQFAQGNEEIHLILNDLNLIRKKALVKVKNRRYQALKQMVEEDTYFSEIEMMKRNPLLYEQLIGQYLSEEEKTERDRIEATDETTLVKVLLEGIERDDAKLRRKEQEDGELEEMEEDSNSAEDMDSDGEPTPCYSQWGEFAADTKVIRVKSAKKREISAEEQALLREEFVASMYESFLLGKDEDFDYESVDRNARFDDAKAADCDEEDKYFDSEEPATVRPPDAESSEDDLDIFMSGMNENSAVAGLSKDIAKM